MRFITPSVAELFNGFTGLFFPNLCVACHTESAKTGSCFCMACFGKLPKSDMYLHSENEVTDRLWGRLPVQFGAARYYFHKKSPVQGAMHALKYRNRPDIGILLGREFGQQIKSLPLFSSVNGLIPVPLHPKKERLRGYNQSERIAAGLSEATGIPVLNDILIRHENRTSQTRKKRMARFGNAEGLYKVHNLSAVEGGHYVLVDDVLTTGATLEMCGQAILEIPETSISVVTLAVAMKTQFG